MILDKHIKCQSAESPSYMSDMITCKIDKYTVDFYLSY